MNNPVAIGYIRISNQDQSNYSIDNQIREITTYCQKYNLTQAKEFIDNGESSYTFDRADFKKLEAYIKAHRPQYIIVYHLDRFSRNLAEALQKIRELLTKYNVRVRDIIEPLDLDDNDPNTFLIRSMRFMMAENELHRIRQRTKAGMMQGALNGRHLNMAPYGYKNARDDSNKPILIIDENKAYHVQLIFKEYIAGNGIEEVRRKVKLFGYKQTSKSAVQKILANPVYTGKIKLPGGKKVVQGLHSPIISEYDFWRAQDLLSGRRKLTHQVKEEVFLRGVIKDYSGNVMTAGNSRNKIGKYYWYYVSKTNRQNFSAKKLHDQFFNLLEKLSFASEDIDWFKEKLTQLIDERTATQNDTIKKLSGKLLEIQKRIGKTEEKYLLQPDISTGTYSRVITSLRADEGKAHMDLLNANRTPNDLISKMNELLPMLSSLKDIFQRMPLNKQQQFIRMLFDNSLAYYNECYRTPFLHPLFLPKAASLKESRLLIIEQPTVKFGVSPIRTENRTIIEHLTDLLSCFVA